MKRSSFVLAVALALVAGASAAQAPSPRPATLAMDSAVPAAISSGTAPSPTARAGASGPVRLAALAPAPRPLRPSASVAAPAAEWSPKSAVLPSARPARPADAGARNELGRPGVGASRQAAGDAAREMDTMKGPAPRVAGWADVVPAAFSPRGLPMLRGGEGGGGAAICGDARLTGTAAATLVGAGACGIENPVRLTSAAGVTLKRPVVVGCKVARRLADWIEADVGPAARKALGARLVAIEPFAGYSCRPRNNRPGARMSLHGTGKAIDVGAFSFDDGREVSVKRDWRAGDGRAAFLRTAWRGACRHFGTVLGPQSDRHHQDHFHVDVAEGRAPYCR